MKAFRKPLLDLIPTEVQCHAGYKAGKSPQRFRGINRWVEVEEVIDRWSQNNRTDKSMTADFFKVMGDDDHEYLLRHDPKSDEWYLVNRW